MCSPGVTARDRVLAELAALGPPAADAFRPGAADPVTLLGEVRELAVFADQIQGELARLAGVLDAVEGAGEAGYKSVAAFLRHACGRSPGRAGELVATGRALRRLEATGKALMAGEISFDAAHVICRALAQISDEALARIAEDQMLAYARTQPPASPHPDPGRGEGDGEAPPEPEQPGPGHAGPDGQAGPSGECAPNGEAGPDGQAGPSGECAPNGEAGPDGERCSGDGPADAAGSSSGAGSGAARSWPAPGLDPTQLRILGEDLIYRADPDAVEERERKRFERRHLSFGFTMENTGTISGACGDTLSLEIIKTAVHAFGPPLGGEDTLDRGPAADGRPDRRLPGRPGLRHRLDPARRRPAPQRPGRRADPGRRGRLLRDVRRRDGLCRGRRLREDRRRDGLCPAPAAARGPAAGRPVLRGRRLRQDRRRDGRRHGLAGRLPDARSAGAAPGPDRIRGHAHRPAGPRPGLPRRAEHHPLERRHPPRRRTPLPDRNPGHPPRAGSPRPGLPRARLRHARRLVHRPSP